MQLCGRYLSTRAFVQPSKGKVSFMTPDGIEWLDAQIAALDELRNAARFVYQATAILPAMFRRSGVDRVASLVARLVTEDQHKLKECLGHAERWLVETMPVFVPVPLAEGERSSACSGAADLLYMLDKLAGATLEPFETMPTDADTLSAALADNFRSNGIPDWLLSMPFDQLKWLADVAERETVVAIKRLTREFQTRQPTFQDAKYHVTLRQMAAIVSKSKSTIEKLKNDGKLPTPDVKGKRGQANEWLWSNVRPILEKEYNRKLPEIFPADRFVGN